jgi:uncharacterized membrane protein YcaP (DUF421 family)
MRRPPSRATTRIAGRRQLQRARAVRRDPAGSPKRSRTTGITQSDESVTGTLIVISTITLLLVAVGWLSFRVGPIRVMTEGEPIILIHDGEFVERNLRRERLTRGDLEEEARKQQLSSLDQIRWAILEDDGGISIIPKG